MLRKAQGHFNTLVNMPAFGADLLPALVSVLPGDALANAIGILAPSKFAKSSKALLTSFDALPLSPFFLVSQSPEVARKKMKKYRDFGLLELLKMDVPEI